MSYNDPEPEAVIDDPEAYSQTKRIREILDRRKQVIDMRNQARREFTFGDVDETAALDAYRNEVESLIIDLYSKLADEEQRLGREYLEERQIGVLSIDPPEGMPTDPHDDRLAPGSKPCETKYVPMNGLNFLFDYPEGVQVRFSTRVNNPTPGLEEDVVQRQLKWSELDRFLLALVEFIDELGVDADFDDGNEDAEFDYSTILDPDSSGAEPAVADGGEVDE